VLCQKHATGNTRVIVLTSDPEDIVRVTDPAPVIALRI